VVQGLFGAAAAIVSLFAIKALFVDPLRNKIGFMPLVQTQDVVFAVPFLLLAGVLVAVIASLLAMRRFLEV